MFKDMDSLVKAALKKEKKRICVAAAGDATVLKSIKKASEIDLIEPILIGDKRKIDGALKKVDYDFKGRIEITQDNQAAAHRAMELIVNQEADLPMKGMLSTGTILKAMLDKKYSFKKEGLLSLLTLIYLTREKRFIILTDSGMNIAPNLEEKVQIVKNSVTLGQALGIKQPKVAILAAVETVNSSMKATTDAAIISKMSQRGQLGEVIVDGPLAFDNAVSKKAAEHKRIKSQVAGEADILVVPDIESGNMLYKSLIIYGKEPAASIIMGASIPLIISSRSDSVETKVNSMALSILFEAGQKILN